MIPDNLCIALLLDRQQNAHCPGCAPPGRPLTDTLNHGWEGDRHDARDDRSCPPELQSRFWRVSSPADLAWLLFGRAFVHPRIDSLHVALDLRKGLEPELPVQPMRIVRDEMPATQPLKSGMAHCHRHHRLR
jgi:hypothetical protein